MEADATSVHYRRARKSDLPAIADLFKRNEYGPREREWLEWKYFENPDGPAIVYVAEDREQGIIAVIARLPRMFVSKMTGEIRVFQNIDLFVAPEFRRRKIYSKLSDYAMHERDYFLMGFPNELSRIVNELDHVIPLYDWIFPITFSQSKKPGIVKVIRSHLEPLLKLYAVFWLGFYPKNLEMKPLSRFREHYKLDESFIHGVRSTTYLNWRFAANPMRPYSLFEFLEGTDSLGYCAFRRNATAAEIYDFVATRRRRECMRLLVEHCRSEQISHLDFRGANLQLGRLGFFRVDSSENCITSDIPGGPRVPDGPWLFTLADRDV
jgi:hypothetical protein